VLEQREKHKYRGQTTREVQCNPGDAQRGTRFAQHA